MWLGEAFGLKKIVCAIVISVFILSSIPAIGMNTSFAKSMDAPVATISSRGPYVSKILFEDYTNVQTMTQALKSGQIDLVANEELNLPEYDSLVNQSGIGIAQSNASQDNEVMFINERPNASLHSSQGAAIALSDINFRHALAWMIGNRSWFLNPVYGPLFTTSGLLLPAYGSQYQAALPPSLQFQNATDGIYEANLILNQSGYKIGPNGFRTTPNGTAISIQFTNRGESDIIAIEQVLVATLQDDLHVQATMVTLSDAQFVSQEAVGHDFDIVIVEGLATTNAVGSFYNTFFNSHQFDIMGLNSSLVDNQTAELLTVGNLTEATNLAQALDLELTNDSSLIMFGYSRLTAAYNSNAFTGWVAAPGNGMYFSWWNYQNVRLSNGSMGGTLTVGVPRDIVSTNIWTANDEYTFEIPLGLVYSSLVQVFGPSTPGPVSLPDLAQSWTTQPAVVNGSQGQIITYNLYNNVTWQDGVPFTSADVAYTFNMMAGNQSTSGNWAGSLENIYNITTPNNYTVKFYVTDPSPFEVNSIGWAPILPEHLWLNVSNPNTYQPKTPIGTGPFEWVTWSPGNYVELQANPHYFLPATQTSPGYWASTSGSNSSASVASSITSSITSSSSVSSSLTSSPSSTVTSSTTSSTSSTTYLVGIAVVVIIIIVGVVLIMRRRPASSSQAKSAGPAA